MNKVGERTEPWRTPRSSVIADDNEPLIFTLHLGDVLLNSLHALSGDRRSTCVSSHSYPSRLIVPPRLRWPLSAILALCSSPYFLFQLPAFFSSFQLASTFSPSFSPLAFFTFSPSFFHFLPQLFSLSPQLFFTFSPSRPRFRGAPSIIWINYAHALESAIDNRSDALASP